MAGRAVYLRTLRPVPSAGPHVIDHVQDGVYGHVATGGAFSPLSLFRNSEQGVWYDPSDFSTMFQDSVGTTPVTAVEQPVGLILDKSKGLVLGPELLTVPLAGGSSGAWVVNSAGVTRNGEDSLQATLYSADAYVFATSKTYLITLTVADFAGDPFFLRLGGGGVVGPFTANGTYSYRVNGGGSFNLSLAPWTGTPGEATITNISVREIAGNHAIQATAAARPVVSAPAYINYDGIDDALAATLPDLGTDATVARAVPTVGTTILTGQTIGAGTFTDTTDHAGLVIIDRALTAGETTALTAYLNAKAGV